jgi:hypothetical protein
VLNSNHIIKTQRYVYNIGFVLISYPGPSKVDGKTVTPALTQQHATGAKNLTPHPQPEFDPRTVQPVASRYTDCVIPGPQQFGNQRCKSRERISGYDNVTGLQVTIRVVVNYYVAGQSDEVQFLTSSL